MQNYPAPALPIVAAMTEAADAAASRTVSFQGAPGANSQIAIEEAFPDALPLPCFAFEDAIDAVKEGRAGCAMIPTRKPWASSSRPTTAMPKLA